MSGQGLFNFAAVVVGLLVIGALFFAVIDRLTVDEGFKKIAKLALGGALVIVLILAVGGLFFGGGGLAGVTPASVLYFGAAAILVLLLLLLFDMGVRRFLPEYADLVMLVVGGVALVILLLVAANVLLGGAVPFRLSR